MLASTLVICLYESSSIHSLLFPSSFSLFYLSILSLADPHLPLPAPPPPPPLGTDRSITVIPSDKIQLIHGADNNSLHAGGFHVIEIAPGVQQLELVNNNNNNIDGDAVIDAHRALDGVRAGEDPGGGGIGAVDGLGLGHRPKR